MRVAGVGERVVGKGRTWKHGDRHADKSSGQGSGLSAVRNENLTPLFLGSVQRLEREYQSGKRTGREGLLNQQSTKSRVISVCFFLSFLWAHLPLLQRSTRQFLRSPEVVIFT